MPHPYHQELTRRQAGKSASLGPPLGGKPGRRQQATRAVQHRGTSGIEAANGARRRLGLALSMCTVVVLAGAYCAVQLLRPVPAVTATVVLAPSHVAALASAGDPAAAEPLPLPTQGAADVAVDGYGPIGGVNQDAVLPLASVTKLMTAVVVLKDHPLAPGEQGPEITVSAADVAAYEAEVAANDSVVRVAAGEQLTELQALEALLVPSADNMADILAVWDAGSVPAFVAKMNAQARSLGLLATHYADTSGLNPASAGSAADMVHLASYVMAQPALRAIVAMPQVTLPVAGTVYNYDNVLGHDGIVGIKTGSTPEAGGNFVFAAQRDLDGHVFTVLGAVLGQGGAQPLQAALDEGERLSVAAFSHIERVKILPAGAKVLAVSSPWGSKTAVVTARPVSAVGVAGEIATTAVEILPSTSKLHAIKSGQQLATVQVSFPGGMAQVPAVAVKALAPAPVTWRLRRI
jgi:D-alanyl-D-alanine carboxypeptidase (penicillin-binding protein 5/6)